MTEHYFSKKHTTKFIKKKINANLLGREFSFFTAASVFSKSKVDKGTEVLINNCQPIGKVLDLGCGYGVVGIVVKKMFDVDVSMTDVNPRALRLANMNIKLNRVEIGIIKSNLFEKVDETFDTILTNPPYVAGRETCIKFITGSYEHLNDKGSLQLVARHQKGGKFLSEKMKEVFGNVEVLGKKSGFRVYKSIKE